MTATRLIEKRMLVPLVLVVGALGASHSAIAANVTVTQLCTTPSTAGLQIQFYNSPSCVNGNQEDLLTTAGDGCTQTPTGNLNDSQGAGVSFAILNGAATGGTCDPGGTANSCALTTGACNEIVVDDNNGTSDITIALTGVTTSTTTTTTSSTTTTTDDTTTTTSSTTTTTDDTTTTTSSTTTTTDDTTTTTSSTTTTTLGLPPAPVPALGVFGIALLASLLGGLGFFGVFRRRG